MSVSVHADRYRIIIDGSGSGGTELAYMTLANNHMAMHKAVGAQAVTVASLGIGASGGGIMCF